MASKKLLVNVVVSILIAASLFKPSTSASELVESVCRRYTDYQFCISTFRLDSRSNKLDLHGLGQISIQITIVKLNDVLLKFPDLRANITDPVGRERLKVCESDYEAAVEKFGGAFKSMEGKAYSDVINWVRDGTNAVIDCQNIYRKSQPIGQSPVSAENLDVLNLSGVILTVDDMLMGL